MKQDLTETFHIRGLNILATNDDKLIIGLLALISLATLITLSTGGITGLATEQISTPIGIEDQVTLFIGADNIQDLVGIQAGLNYNNQVLQYSHAEELDFLNEGGSADTYFPDTIVTNPGSLSNIILMRLSAGGVSGTGEILAIHFNVIGSGDSGISFTELFGSDSAANNVDINRITTHLEVITSDPPAPSEYPLIPSAQVSPGESVQVQLYGMSVNDLIGIQFGNNFNNVLSIPCNMGTGCDINLEAGQLLASGSDIYEPGENTNTPGQFSNAILLRLGGNGVSGSGLVATYELAAATAGVAQLAFNELLLSTSGGSSINPHAIDPRVIVTGEPEPPSCNPVPELCDGKDNDCDGTIDEGVKNACGYCGLLPTEVCDGEDNDCDGTIDEGVSNACGSCGEVPEELCDDNKDNNCNGQIDEGCDTPPPTYGIPSTITNLQATRQTNGEITISWTAADNGEGKAVSGYDFRYSDSLEVINWWGSAQNIPRGDCTTFTIFGPGSLQKCTIRAGNLDAVDHNAGLFFRLVPYNGVIGQGATFAEKLSNVAEAEATPTDMSCSVDEDCKDKTICPTVIGGDTPYCNSGTCDCGPSSSYCNNDADCGPIERCFDNTCLQPCAIPTCAAPPAGCEYKSNNALDNYGCPLYPCGELECTNQCDYNNQCAAGFYCIDSVCQNTCPTTGEPISNEICDGKDNNCNGAIDEGATNACGTCGQVPAEVCDDNIDNDCDGTIDEGCYTCPEWIPPAGDCTWDTYVDERGCTLPTNLECPETCTFDFECTNPPVCVTTPCDWNNICVEGTCEYTPVQTSECTTNAECNVGEVCDEGVCYTPLNACGLDADCGLGEVCIDGVCYLPVCVDITDLLREGETKTYTIDGWDYEVSIFTITEPLTGLPEAKLFINGEFTAALNEGERDSLSNGLEVGINEVLVSNEGSSVEFSLGMCDPECVSDADCPVNNECRANKCFESSPECTTNAECNVGEVCIEETCWDIPTECTFDSDCESPYAVCLENECVDIMCDPFYSCMTDADCDVGAVCVNNENGCGGTICVPDPTIEVCDGKDNDGDGIVDEGVRNACGDCGAVPVEVCDRVDNDCDGIVDEVCSPAGKDTPGASHGEKKGWAKRSYDVHFGGRTVNTVSLSVNDDTTSDVSVDILEQSTVPFKKPKKSDVYEKFSLEAINFVEGDLADARITFTVDEQWVEDYVGAGEEIALYTWDGTSWTVARATEIGSTDEGIMYSAAATTVSDYAIGTADNTVSVEPTKVAESTFSISSGVSQFGQVFALFLLFGVIIAGAVLGSLYVHKQVLVHQAPPLSPQKAQQLDRYILNARAKGKSDEEIKKSLVARGWKESTVNDYFKR